MPREHAGGAPAIAFELRGTNAYGRQIRQPIPIVKFPFETVCADFDGPPPREEIDIAVKHCLPVLQELLLWVHGEGRRRGQKTRLFVLFKAFLPEFYNGATDQSMARAAGLLRKQSFSREKLNFARKYGFTDRNMRSEKACASMSRSYHHRQGRKTRKACAYGQA